MKGFVQDIERLAVGNDDFRRVLYTAKHCQLVLMALAPGEEIGAEVWLENAWHLIDPTRLAAEDQLVRIAIGRDATDVSFMTIFGAAELRDQRVTVSLVAPQQA